MTEPHSERFNLRLFGQPSIEVVADSFPKRVRLDLLSRQRKPLALIAVLCVCGNKGISRDELVALLWPELEPARARNALSQLLFRVRRVLGTDVVDSRGDIRLNEGSVSSDIQEFERALAAGHVEAAAAAYTGPFMDGFSIPDAPVFEKWMCDRRASYDLRFDVARGRGPASAVRHGGPWRGSGSAEDDGGQWLSGRALYGIGLGIVLAVAVAVVLAFVSRRDTSPLVIVPALLNETSDSTFDAVCRLAAYAAAQEFAATHLVSVEDEAALAGDAGRPPTALADARNGDIVSGRLLMEANGDTLVLVVRVLRAADGRVLYQGPPITGPAKSTEWIIQATRAAASAALRVLVPTDDVRLPQGSGARAR